MRNICGQSKWSETGRWAATLPSPALAEVPGRPQFPRQIHSCQWLSDGPNTFLGRRGYILHICWGLGVLEDHAYRNTGETFKLKKQSSFFWMNFTIGTSGPLDPVFHPLLLLSVYALWWQNWSFLLLPSFICHCETQNHHFHFICWKPKAANLLDIGASGAD